MNLNKLTSDELTLTGKLARTSDGGFALTLTGKPGTEPPIPPPVDAIVITPSGGDDTGLIQQHLNDLQPDKTLMLSGMFNVGNTIWIDGYAKTLAGDPAKPSGIRSTNAGIMSGPYASMLCVRDADDCRIHTLELDAQNHPTELVFFTGANNCEIHGCYLHDVAFHSGGPPYGAIHSEGCGALVVVNNRVERTKQGGAGVRGIWIRANTILVEGNHTADTGHTGIAVEGLNVLMARNTVERSLTDGTGLKMCCRDNGYGGYRRRKASVSLECIENTVNGTINGGIMLEDCEEAAVTVENNQFLNCGKEGTSFGALYSPYAVGSLTWRNNRAENCRSLGALRHARNFTFTDTTFAGGSNVLWLEDDCHQITLTRSGQVNVGSNCSQITVDGKVVA